MRIFRHYDRIPPAARGSVVALGNFDGLHRGHRGVIAEAGRRARASGAPLAVLTFEPHPRDYFQPSTVPFRLTPFRAKMRLLEEIGVDAVFNLRFGPALAGQMAEAFVATVLVGGLAISHLVVGPGFVFGKGRGGNAALLHDMGLSEGFGFSEVEAIRDGGQGAGTMFASTDIRVLIRRGQVDLAARALGRIWEIEARVQHGESRGEALGFPTANMPLDGVLHPGPGIYAVRVGLADGGAVTWHDAAAYIGTRPTFAGETMLLEVYLFDYSADLYDRRLRVAFVGLVRKDQTFDSPQNLKVQMAADCERAREILATARQRPKEIP